MRRDLNRCTSRTAASHMVKYLMAGHLMYVLLLRVQNFLKSFPSSQKKRRAGKFVRVLAMKEYGRME